MTQPKVVFTLRKTDNQVQVQVQGGPSGDGRLLLVPGHALSTLYGLCYSAQNSSVMATIIHFKVDGA